MDGRTIDDSLPITDTIQDHTVMVTPQPQAASTAFKSTNNQATMLESRRNIEHKQSDGQFIQSSHLNTTNKLTPDFDCKLKKSFDRKEKKNKSYYDSHMVLQTEKTFPSYHCMPEDLSTSTSRASIFSSSDSSLGILPSTVIQDAQEESLAEYNEEDKFELSQRLEKELQLGPFGPQEESLSNNCSKGYGEKDTFELSQRLEKELQLGSYSCAKFEEPVNCNTNQFPIDSNNQNLTNTNDTSLITTNNSKFSIDSEMFKSDENVLERLQRDEEEWRGQFDKDSLSSLSGIYDDEELSFRKQGRKISISSFLRSGSGPLGCLDSVTNITNNQRPNFGLTVDSPEKKSSSKPIRPPPQDNQTFVINEESLCSKYDNNKCNPWDQQSLIKHYSMLHNCSQSEVSVPSISYISNLLSEKKENLNPREIFDKLTGQESFYRRFSSDNASKNNLRKSFAFNNDSNQLPHKDHKITERCEDFIMKDNSDFHSICDITGFDGDDQEYVCVLTPVSMDFEIANNTTDSMHYSITKSCFINNVKEESAALVHLPLNNLTLLPNEKRVVPVVVAAFVEGTIKIKLEVARNKVSTQEFEINTIFGKIAAELPKISLKTPAFLNFKLMDNFCEENIEVCNYGLSLVPLKLKISQINFVNVNIFYFYEENCKIISVLIKPGQTFKQRIYCQAPLIYEIVKTIGVKKMSLLAQIDIVLDTSSEHQLPPLLTIPLRSEIEVMNSRDIKLKGNRPTPCLFYNSGNELVSMEVSTTADYYVQTPVITIPPLQTANLLISYLGNSNRKGTLTLHDVSHGTFSSMNLYPTTHCSSTNSSLVTPQGSRASSPFCPANFGIYGDELKVKCTHKELVWGGCPLQQRVLRTCILKNEGSHREKLRLTTTSDSHCFKILNDRHNLENEIKLSLQPMQSCHVSIALLAGSTGPKWGQLTISRINAHLDKKVIPLYGFGGKAKVAIEGILQDPEQHMWIYLDSDSLTCSFTLMNKGDFSAFFKISDGMSATSVGGGLSIAPPEGILLPGISMVIEIALSVTADRLEYLLAKPSQSAICITRLAVIHGDESTRLRLSRLSTVDHMVANKLSTLSHHLPVSMIPEIEKLNDPIGCGEILWLDDVTEWTIGVLVRRSSLEAMRLDTSSDFVDLSNTVSQV